MAHSSSRLVVGSWSMRFKIHAFSQSAGQIRPVNSGVVGGIEESVSQLPVALVEGIVPLRCLVAQWTSPVAERHTTVHATGSLLTAVVAIQCLFYLAEIEDSIVDWSITCFFARYSQKCFWISHLFKSKRVKGKR